MEPRTHLEIDPRWSGAPASLTEGAATVVLQTIPEMRADAQGLVHGGFVFSCADHAAMLAVNDPNVVLGEAQVRFVAPVRVGQTVVARAIVTGTSGRKRTVEVVCAVGDQEVLRATLTALVLDRHVLGDVFRDQAAGYDSRPVPVQIAQGVIAAIRERVALSAEGSVMDFGAGTGLVSAGIAPFVREIHAVDVSAAMLAQLAAKEALRGKVHVHCQDLVAQPLDVRVDLVVSAMALHHVRDVAALFRAFHAHLRPGGQLALADLDAEDGASHPPNTHGVHHAGFRREALGALLADAGFTDIAFTRAVEVQREGGGIHRVFLVTARRA